MGRSWWRRRDRLALNKLGTAGASNPPPPESDPAVEHALPLLPPPESDTVVEHDLPSPHPPPPPPPPPPESDTVVVFAPPSPPPLPLESDTVVVFAPPSPPPPPESDTVVEHLLPSPHPPSESDTVVEHALLSPPPPPPPESDTVVVFAPPSPPPPLPLESDTVVEHVLPSPPPSPPSVVLNHPPACVNQSRFKPPSLLDCAEDVPSASDSPDGHGADNSDGHNRGEGAVAHHYSDSDDDEDPVLTDRYGNLTTWRLSDLEAAFDKHLEDEASKPKVEEKKYSKEEILKRNADRKKQFMEYAVQKYNNEEDLAEELRFVFDEIKEEVYIIEEGMKFYEHFNFTAKQAGSMVLFFAEVIPDGDTCDVLCCKPLDLNDNGHCFGCKNQRSVNLRHPADEALYVGGHEDCQFPFMWDSISEDDSD